jgi:uncharacterized Zn finger protein
MEQQGDPRPPGGDRPRDRDHRRRRRRRHRRPRKLPPPEHGIRLQQVGATWWGERWVAALLRLGRNYVARLHRGHAYAKQGRVHDLSVSRNVVTASVTGSRPEPYRVQLALRPLKDRIWERAIRVMAAKARFAAELLGGQMPREIDDAFAAARASLFPLRNEDMRTRCSCPDSANPCKHIAALHLVLGEAFDRDPFLLFELRGRSREQVLSALRQVRAGATATAPSRVRVDRPAPAAPPMIEEGATAPDPGPRPAYEQFRRPVEDLRFKITEPAVEGVTLRQLGPPPAWSLDQPLPHLLHRALSRAARVARDLALEAQPEARTPARRSPSAAKRSDGQPSAEG